VLDRMNVLVYYINSTLIQRYAVPYTDSDTGGAK